jgi:preprotein translocase subunit SecA
LSNDELRAKTSELKGKIKAKTKAKDDEIVALKEQIETDLKLSIVEKENIYAKIDALDKEILDQIE